MRNLHELDKYRRRAEEIELYGVNGDATCGVFTVLHGSIELAVIASCGGSWEHVSVSARDRCPSWDEMEFVKRLFFKDDETAMQLHVPRGDHINAHPFCLHLWRPRVRRIPRPPGWMVAPK